MFKKIRRFKNGKRNKAAVCIEFAFVAPIFFLIVIASIEFARVHMIQCAVENACFEGARRGIVPGATASACETTASNLLTLAGVDDFAVTVEPATLDASTKSIEVTATVPINAENGFGVSGFFKGRSLTKKISLPVQVK